MSKLGIVVVGYNRLENLQRILNRLNDCNYEDDNLLLIVSLDNSGMDSLPVFAKISNGYMETSMLKHFLRG